jgi:hypothetical protein
VTAHVRHFSATVAAQTSPLMFLLPPLLLLAVPLLQVAVGPLGTGLSQISNWSYVPLSSQMDTAGWLQRPYSLPEATRWAPHLVGRGGHLQLS